MHVGALTEVYYEGEKLCEQLLTSPISDKTFGKALKAVFAAGTRVFSLPGGYSYKHAQWGNERNYGVIAVDPLSQPGPGSARAPTTALVPVEKPPCSSCGGCLVS